MASKVLYITSDVIGRGEDKLGGLLMANFLRLLGENSEKPAAMVFMNTGVRVLCEGSNLLGYVKKLEQQGVEMLACTTCLEYFDLAEKLVVGKPTTMAKSIHTLMTAEAVTL